MNNDLLAFLQQEEARSYDASLLEEVEVAIKSYNGEPYGDEEDGRSQVVTRDVAETIDWMVPSIMRTLMSSDRIAELDPDDTSNEQHARDATEKLHDDMRRRCYDLIHDYVKAGCQEKLGIIKTCVESRKQRNEQLVPDLMIPDHAIEAEETEHFDVFGNQMFRVVTLEDSPPQIKDYNVPLEEFGFSPDTRELDSSPYLRHSIDKSISELVEMGYPLEQVEDLQDDDASKFLVTSRDDGRSEWQSDRIGVLRKVRYHEEYVFFDADGDGIAERLKVCRVGNTILDIEVVNYQPFEFWTPYRMPNRLVGQSVADKVVDLQRQTTVLKRNALDSLYFSTAPGTYIHEDSVGDHTIDDLLTVRPGRLVRFKGQMAPVPEQRNDVSQVAFAAIEQLHGERESRTGITRLNQGLDADALNKTAAGTGMMQAAGQLQEDYLARNVANSLARWFLRKYQLMREFGQPFRLRVDGEDREVDPSQWPESMDIKVRVGLGSGRKDERLMYRRELGQYQAMLKQSGSILVNDEVIHKNLSGLARDMGFSPNDLWVDPAKAPPQEAPPDPEMAKVQLEAQKAQAKQQLDEMQAMHKAQLAEMGHQLKSADAEGKAQLETFKAMSKQHLEEQKAAFEARLAWMESMFEQRLAEKKQADDHEIKKNRPGGDLSK